jgi:hypothetical protein
MPNDFEAGKQSALISVTSDLTFGYLIHDAWTETYVGVHRIAFELLPERLKEQDVALCKLAIVGAHHMMEVALFRLLGPRAGARFTAKKLGGSTFSDALTKLTPMVVGAIDLSQEPFTSTERVRHRRNETVHHLSAGATRAMARSALHSATEGTRALYAHFQVDFPYQPFLDKWPAPSQPHFSAVPLA